MAIRRDSHNNGFSKSRNAGGKHGRHSSNGFSSYSQIDNVAGYSSRSSSGARHRMRRQANTRPIPRAEKNGFWDKGVASLPWGNGELLLTRRHFLYGAAGVGVLAAAGVGVKTFTATSSEESDLNILSVPKSAVTESDSLTELENGGKLSLTADVELPYGTLMWASNDDYAALLLPTETGSPLTKVGLLRLSSGYYFTIMDQALGLAEGFEIYDVRASSEGIVWTEVDILEGIWRIYGARLADAVVTDPHLLDQGDSSWETPSIAICGDEAFWQVLPNLNGSAKTQPSTLRCAPVTGGKYEVVLASNGRMCTPLYASDKQITLTPRAQSASVRYELTVIDAATKSILDTVVLPQSMRPLEAGYGKTGFMFSFEGIYNYGDGIANLGTYAPKRDARNGDHSAVPWFHFARTPSAPPCWCGDYLVVKSTRSVVCIDVVNNTYFLFDAKSGADNYGNYLASTGNRKRLLIFSNIKEEGLTGSVSQYCSARIYTAPDSEPESTLAPTSESDAEAEADESESEA